MVVLRILFLCFVLNAAVVANRRVKRSIFNLRNLFMCERGHGGSPYIGYGCFCGLGARGDTAVDQIDTCCQKHDECYELPESDSDCSIYFEGYSFDCDQIKQLATCGESNDACESLLCECDLELLRCLAEYPEPNTKASCPAQNSVGDDTEDTD